jgi:hypothetical protein
MPYFNAERLPKHLRLLTAAYALTAVVGCSDDSSTPFEAPSQITGMYALADVGGNALPASIYDGPWTINGQRINVRISVKSSTLLLDTDERFELLLQLEAVAQEQTAPLLLSVQGTYRRVGERIDFRSDDASQGGFVAGLRGNELTIPIDLAGDGHPPIYTFRK